MYWYAAYGAITLEANTPDNVAPAVNASVTVLSCITNLTTCPLEGAGGNVNVAV